MAYGAYTGAWAKETYLDVRPEEFTYSPNRGEKARAVEADPNRLQHVGTVDVATDQVATEAIDVTHGQTHDGFPEDFWDPITSMGAFDEGHYNRAVNPSRYTDEERIAARSADDGTPAHRLRRWTWLGDTSETFNTATAYDPEAYLLPDPTGPDAQRLISAGHGAFNSYASKNSYARHPMETFVRENRVMQGGNLDNPHDIRPLYYQRGNATVDIPATGPAEGGWGLVYGGWDSFTPEYLAQPPYDAGDTQSPALTGPPTPDLDFGW